MSTTMPNEGRPRGGREPAAPLSAAEQAVLERVKARAGRKRESALWRFGKSPPTFLWWGCW